MKKIHVTIRLFIVFIYMLSTGACKDDAIYQTQSDINSNTELQLFSAVPSAKSNITFNNRVEENFENFFAIFNYVYNGAGVAIGDINNDGLSDVYLIGNEVPNKLYLNKGDFIFEDITESAMVSGGGGWHNGTVMADINGDGYLDIYVCRGGYNDATRDRTNLLYINQGDNTFLEQAAAFGIDENGYSVMASFFDVDGDNDLDLYVTNRPNTFFLNYQQVLAGKLKEDNLFRDKLYINEDGKFVERGKASGIINNFGYGLGLATSDMNSDGLIDIMVSNDYLERDYLYINQGKSNTSDHVTFKEELEAHFNHVPFYAMGIDVVDFNNDGFEDIIQLEMLPEDYERSKTTMASMNTKLFNDMTSNGFHFQYMHNQLHLNRGNGIYSDIAAYAGVDKTDWSWACLGSDFDNDGYRDIFITNGFKRDIWDKDANAQFQKYMSDPHNQNKTKEQKAEHITNLFDENKIPNYVYKNNGNLMFSNKAEAWGLGEPSLSSGAAVGDLDNDGDLDLIVNNMDGEAFLYKNNAEQLQNKYLKIKLMGPAKNPEGLGAKVTITYDDQLQFHEFKTVRGYLSSVEPIIHFGLGEATLIAECKVQWSDGRVSILKDIESNQEITVDYKDANDSGSSETTVLAVLHEATDDVFDAPFIHKENAYDDFRNQILLPHKLSQSGPCITVADINNDKLEDIYVGGAASQSGMIYLQEREGTFKATTQNAFLRDAVHEDVGAVFFDADGDEDVDLYVVSGGNEFKRKSENLQDRLYLNDGYGAFAKSDKLPDMRESGSCVEPLDYDGDGDLDLFIGGRLVPDGYPRAPSSSILENVDGVFEDVTAVVAPDMQNIGMVTSAAWSDVDGDGAEELILVGEWMPITIFRRDGKEFKNVTTSFGLDKTNGWWNKIVAADLDLDGDTDYVVGNIGLNYKFKASEESPFAIYADDFDQNGTNDIFLAKLYKDREVPVRGWQCSAQQMPEIAKKFNSYSEFAKADITDIIGADKSLGAKYIAQQFASVILENNEGILNIKKLPAEAQFSAVNGVVVEDFDKDGLMDILIAGNKYEVEVETTRADASIGSLFLGTDSGEYRALNHLESGYCVPENVKEVQSIMMADGELGILTGINDGQLKIHIRKAN